MKNALLAVSIVLMIFNTNAAFAQQPGNANPDELSQQELRLVATAKSLSATTLVDGPGWEKYGSYLLADFSRWSAGQDVMAVTSRLS